MSSGNHLGKGFLALLFTLYCLPNFAWLIMKLVVFLLLTAIFISLGAGLYHLSRNESDSRKTLKALKIRVALSAVLIVFLVGSWYFGYIQ